MYTVLTGHALVDKDNESNLRGVHIRAYCPTISQQASTSVDMCFIQSLSGEQIEEKAKQLLEDGFAVRGTARSQSKAAPFCEALSQYGDKFELVIVDDFTKVCAVLA